MEKKIYRKVKSGKAKDYRRDEKLYDYYYIIYKNTRFMLNWNGWDTGEKVYNFDGENCIEIDGKRIFLDFN